MWWLNFEFWLCFVPKLKKKKTLVIETELRWPGGDPYGPHFNLSEFLSSSYFRKVECLHFFVTKKVWYQFSDRKITARWLKGMRKYSGSILIMLNGLFKKIVNEKMFTTIWSCKRCMRACVCCIAFVATLYTI